MSEKSKNTKQNEICRQFQRDGHCKFGNRCKFIHQNSESNQKKYVNRSKNENNMKTLKVKPLDKKYGYIILIYVSSFPHPNIIDEIKSRIREKLQKPILKEHMFLSYKDSDGDTISLFDQDDYNTFINDTNSGLMVLFDVKETPISSRYGAQRTNLSSSYRDEQWINEMLESFKKGENHKVIEELSKNSLRLKTLLDKRGMDDHLICTILELFSHRLLIDSPIKSKVNQIYSLLLDSHFLSDMENLLKYVSKIGNEAYTNQPIPECLVEKFTWVFTVLTQLYEKFPTQSFSLVDIILCILDIEFFKNSPSLHLPFEYLLDMVDTKKKEENRIIELQKEITSPEKNLKETIQGQNDDNFNMPDHILNLYQEVSIFPTKEDLTNAYQQTLARNIMKGSFTSALSYLSTHFHLLRADCMLPLRSGLLEFQKSVESGVNFNNIPKGKFVKNSHFRIYNKIGFCGMKCDFREGITYQIRFQIYGFSMKKTQSIKWERSKRLTYGGLICLSSDNFKNSLFWGTVVDRDPKQLRSFTPSISVSLNSTFVDIEELAKSQDLLMIEVSSVYFEAYKHVLSSIQKISPPELPFTRYLIECKTDIQPPSFLRLGLGLQRELSLKNTFDDPTPEQLKEREIDEELFPSKIRNFDILGEWPKFWSTLDESQLNAIKSMLKNEVSLIQGPPGTGKTYVGLLAAKMLLSQNDAAFKFPILVITYTNHALDQFLEGIIKFEESVIRVGGRSKSEILNPYNLREKRKTPLKSDLFNSRRVLSGKIHNLKEQIDFTIKQLNWNSMTSYNLNQCSIISTDQFESLLEIPDKVESHKKFLEEHGENLNNEPFNVWLNEDHIINNSIRIQKELIMQSEKEKGFQVVGKKGKNKNKNKNENENEKNSTKSVELNNNNMFSALDPSSNAKKKKEKKVVEEEEKVVEDDENEDEEYDGRNRRQKTLKSLAQVVNPSQTFNLRENIEEENGDDENDDDSEDGDGEEGDVLQEEKERKDQEETGLLAGEFDDQTKDKKEEKMHEVNLGRLEVDQESIQEFEKIPNLWEVPFHLRNQIANKWFLNFKEQKKNEIRGLEDEFSNLSQQLEEILGGIDNLILSKSKIVAMTTTGLAQRSSVIKELKPEIIIVEEAAEVLEAHILPSLTPHAKQLILIGDHIQLRPSTAVYELGKDYHLDISLFERMILNNIEHVTLSTQRRMRPQFSALLKDLYPNLQDHPIVTTERKNVLGIKSNLWFLDHMVPEDQKQNDETSESKSNIYEAEFIGSLSRYFILQGYKPSQITILTFYIGQQFKIMDQLTNECRGIRVTTIDKYQGEENDIIILSCVRSNGECRIGHTGIKNRICVGLSRAREGMFVIGNRKCLVGNEKRKNNLWSKIFKRWPEDCIGPSLPLCCFNHPSTVTYVSNRNDFSKAPNGGCNLPCKTRLECGHICPQACHPTSHDNVKCHKLCERKKECGHNCINEEGKRKKCYETCGSCLEKVVKTLSCGHEQQVYCSDDIKMVVCTSPCRGRLECTHPCPGKCGNCHLRKLQDLMRVGNVDQGIASQFCKQKCKRVVKKKVVGCGHIIDSLCSETPTQSDCTSPCLGERRCGHPCTGTCGKCLQGTLHIECNRKCDRVLVCSHICRESCTSHCPPCKEKCETACIHSDCDKKCGEKCAMCIEKCLWQCIHYQCTKMCGEICDRPVCNERCPSKLKCGHRCIGLCGEECPSICKECNPNDENFTIFFGTEDEEDSLFIKLPDCGHILEYSGMDQYFENIRKSPSIQIPKCPKCNTSIRKSLRYTNYLKQKQRDIDRVKDKILESYKNQQKVIQECKNEVLEALEFKNNIIPKALKNFLILLEREKMNPQEVNICQSRNELFKLTIEWGQNLKKGINEEIKTISPLINQIFEKTDQICLNLNQASTVDKFLSLQENLNSFKDVSEAKILFDVLVSFHNSGLLSPAESQELMNEDQERMEIDRLFEKPSSCVLSEINRKRIKDLVKPRWHRVTDRPLSEHEKVSIVNALNLGAGHWYKCPNGHIYAIGECGGAMEESKCNECGEKIGGGSHRLTSGNSHASEMDGSIHPAWPT